MTNSQRFAAEDAAENLELDSISNLVRFLETQRRFQYNHPISGWTKGRIYGIDLLNNLVLFWGDEDYMEGGSEGAIWISFYNQDNPGFPREKLIKHYPLNKQSYK